MKRAAVLLLATAATMTLGCDAPAPRKSVDDIAREMERTMRQTYLTGELVRCLPEPLTAAQKDYLLRIGRDPELGDYAVQRYLLAIGGEDAAVCQWRAIQNCERISPGQCIAPKP